MDLVELRKRRKALHWSKILPYLPYVFQSGVAVLLLILMIAFSAWYTRFLQHIPEGLPIGWIMILLLGPAVIYSGFRTYIHPADSVFLLPKEASMSTYFKPAFWSGILYKLSGTYAILLVLWPLYQRSDGIRHPFWIWLIVLLLLKLAGAYGAWQELKIASHRARAGFRLLRWCVLLLLLAAWVWQPAWKSLLFLILVVVNYVLALRFPMKHRVPWENLIAAEKASAANNMLVLGWFVDVPAEGQGVSPRRWLDWIGKRISWSREGAYRYLLTKTLVRGELLGIGARLTILGAILVGWCGRTWLGLGLYLFFVFLIGAQLSVLRHAHRDSSAALYYPLPSGARKKEAADLGSRTLAGAAVIMWLPLLPQGDGPLTYLGGSLVAGLILVYAMRSNWNRKWREEEED